MPRVIPQRELRNDIGRVLRQVAAGEEIVITVRGEPVGELRPVRARRRYAPLAAVARELRALPPDPGLLEAVRAARDDLGYLDEL